MATIVYLDAYPLAGMDITPISSLGDYTQYEITTPEERIERCVNADIVIVNKVVMDKQIISHLPRLKLICVSATGMNNVDLEYAAIRGIEVKNVAGYSTDSVAESTFAYLFALLRNISYYDNYVKSGEYSTSGLCFHTAKRISEIAGKRWGIIGMGSIGSRVEELAKAFGAETVHHSVRGNGMPLDELLSSSDIVSIHTPLSDLTRNLITYDKLLKMKRSAVLINVARGGIVNETDLARALDESLIAGAGVDVFETEPPSKNNPLLRLKNPDRLVCAPHSAWASKEAITTLIDGVAANIYEFIRSRQL